MTVLLCTRCGERPAVDKHWLRCIECRRDYHRAYRAARRIALNQKAQERNAKNRGAQRARSLRYVRTHWQSLRPKLIAAKHASRGVPTDPENIRVLLRDPCAYCGGPGGETDHIIPVASGGTGEWENLTASCRRCNARKANKSLLQFLAEVAS